MPNYSIDAEPLFPLSIIWGETAVITEKAGRSVYYRPSHAIDIPDSSES
jgi:hypothetical protein